MYWVGRCEYIPKTPMREDLSVISGISRHSLTREEHAADRSSKGSLKAVASSADVAPVDTLLASSGALASRQALSKPRGRARAYKVELSLR